MRIQFKYSLLAILILWISNLYSQRIISPDNKYSFEDNLYEFQDMEDIFIVNFDSYMEYKDALRARKNSRLFGRITLGVMTVSTLAIMLDSDPDPCEFLCFPTVGQIIGTAGISIGLITGLVGLITKINYNSRRKKAVDKFNAAGDIGQLYTPASWNASFGSAPHGVGLTINF